MRGIAHLIDLIPYQKGIEKLTVQKLSLPLNSAAQLKKSSLAYHILHEDQALGIIKVWEEAKKNDLYLPVQTEYVYRMAYMSDMPKEYLYHIWRRKPITDFPFYRVV